MDEKNKSLGRKLSELIWAHDPDVTKVDPVACAKAANEVAGVLGCLVAALTIAEPERHDEVVAIAMGVVDKTAKSIRTKAVSQFREPGHA
jgi:hypothetical protein